MKRQLGLRSHKSKVLLKQCTEVRFASFLSGGFITAIIVNPLERKLAKRTSVQWFDVLMYIPNSEFEIILIITIIFR